MTTIRAAERSDLEELVRLRNTLWPETPDEHREALLEFFDGDEAHMDHILVALDETGAYIGFAELRIRNYAEGSLNHRVPFLEGWFVASRQRRRGVGAALINAAGSWARSLGFTELASNSVLGNTVSLDAHVALGFEEVVRTVSYLKEL